MTKITPVILAGGSGTRLWPLSRKSYPKQFSNILGENTLFQETAKKFLSSEQTEYSELITMTSEEFRFIASDQLKNIGMYSSNIVIEPSSRNTAPSILAATLFALRENKDSILLVMPSDHLIPDIKGFLQLVSTGKEMLNVGKIIIFGVSPTRPETGYGYLELTQPDILGPQNIVRFVEKPDKVLAEKFLMDRKYLWNSGIFLFRCSDMLEAFQTQFPQMIEPVKNAIEDGENDLNFFRMSKEAWENCDDISIDYAIMEKIDNLSVIPFLGEWSDLGGWNSVWENFYPDKKGVALSKNATALDCEDVLLRSEDPNQEIVGIGLKNLLAVAMPDAVLLVDKSRDQDVKEAVKILREKNIMQSEIFPKDYRPWGWFESIANGNNFQVKRIVVNPGASLSLQSHKFRSENWIVVNGIAKVTIGEIVKYIKASESAHIPVEAVHRLENETKEQLVIIEVQSGTYLGEDDIIRHKDKFNRD